MHAAALSTSPFGSAMSRAQVYNRVGIETGVLDASPHKLVAMLFEGFFDALAQARGALGTGDVEIKGRAIGRAARIVDEGLRAGLDLSGGGSLARDLSELYAYVSRRLIEANLRNDAEALDECARLMQPLREAWQSIAPQVHAATR